MPMLPQDVANLVGLLSKRAGFAFLYRLYFSERNGIFKRIIEKNDRFLAGEKMSVNKRDIIKLLETIAIYMELKGENPFKVSAFRKAAAALEADDRSLSAFDDFTTLNGIGKGTAAVIDEFINEGKSTY